MQHTAHPYHHLHASKLAPILRDHNSTQKVQHHQLSLACMGPKPEVSSDTPATLLAHAKSRNEYRKNCSSSERANNAAGQDAAMVSVASRCCMLLRCTTRSWSYGLLEEKCVKF